MIFSLCLLSDPIISGFSSTSLITIRLNVVTMYGINRASLFQRRQGGRCFFKVKNGPSYRIDGNTSAHGTENDEKNIF